METRANYVIVGLITMSVLLASFIFVYWIARFGDTTDNVPLEIRIPGSVTGLSVGSQVLFNGIKVGDVRRLNIDLKDPKVVIAMTEVYSGTPVTATTKATLGFQGLTGQAYIELSGGDPNAPNILTVAQETGVPAQISADLGAVNNLIDRAQEIATSATRVFTALDQFVTENKQPLTDTIDNAAKFSEALGNNADQIDEFLASAGELSKTLSSVSGKLESTLTSADELLKSVDKAKVDRILANAEKVSIDIAASSGEIKTIVDSVKSSAQNIADLSAKAKASLDNVDRLMASADPEKVKSVIDNLDAASKTARTASEDIGKVTAKFGNRAEDIDQIVANAKELSGRLNQTTVRVDGVLEKISAFLGNTEGAGPGLVEDARATLLSFRKVADTLNASLGNITANIEKFSGRGLGNVDSLVQDTRRSVNRIEQAITDLEKNPQRLIFGGQGSVPRYDNRNRR